jgi:UDP-glucose 4-epimerase
VAETGTFRTRRVLVTGASGFIGSHLCRRLLEEGAEVFAISRKQRPNPVNGPQWRQLDLTDIDAVRSGLEGIRPDLIFHLSSYAQGERELALVLPTFWSDLAATINVLTAATEIGFERLVTAGSMEESVADEIPSSPYAAAKSASRSYTRMFHLLYKAPAVMTRIFMTYGPGQPSKKIIPYCITSFSRGVPVKISSPHRKVDWIHIDDVVRGLLAVALTPGLEGHSVDLGSGELIEIQEVVSRIQRIMRTDVPVEFGGLPERSWEQVRCSDASKTFNQIGWRPRITLDSGLESTVRFFSGAIR